MDLYEADANFRPDILVENYESLIWTDRWQQAGDFQLTMKEQYLVTSNLKANKYLLTSESNRVMMIETVETQKQTDGTNFVVLKGRSIEAFLQFRSAKRADDNRQPESIYGTPGGIANYLVRKYCVDPTLAGAVNVIPGLEIATAPAAGMLRMELERGPIYDMLKAVAQAHGFGFQIHRNGNAPLTFIVTNPYDYSLPGMSYREFSGDANNLIDVSTVESIANYKNHARVMGAKVGVDVYLPGTPSTVSGFNRRTLAVDAYDVGTGPTSIQDDRESLANRGLEALADHNNRYFLLIDGDVPAHLPPGYFTLGDIYMVKDGYQNRQRMQVTEVIYSSNPTGDRKTPTFAVVD